LKYGKIIAAVKRPKKVSPGFSDYFAGANLAAVPGIPGVIVN
jgi:hypothetical protein